jgi:signal transduction histidine kinase
MRRTLIGDGALALAVAGASTAVTARFLDGSSVEDRLVDPLALAIVAAAGLSLVARRRWPVPVLGLVTVLTAAYLLAGYPYGPVFVSLLVAVYTVARHRPFAASAPASGLALAVVLTHLLTHEAALPGWLGLIPGSAWVVVPFAIGTTVRIAAEADDAARAEALRQRLDDERLRIAEEVHDVVGHGLAAIQMQADIALHVSDRRPDQAKAALEAISRTSAEAFEELRSTLHLIRRWGDPPLEPAAPGLHRLAELCQRIRQAGVAVELAVSGQPLDLPPAVDTAAYRVMQEALTNVIRHGAVPAATARISYGDGAVDLAVTNPGPVSSGIDGGLGIPGMRRRVEALHGTFHAGPTGEGFEVRARMPAGAPA